MRGLCGIRLGARLIRHVPCNRHFPAAGDATCGAEALLTATNTHSLNKVGTATVAGFSFTSAGYYADTAVDPGSNSNKVRLFTFCAEPTYLDGTTAVSTAKVNKMCLRFSLFVAELDRFDADTLSDTVEVVTKGTYTCGAYTEPLTLFDNKADVQFQGIAYAGAEERVGFRIIAVSETGTMTFTEEVQGLRHHFGPDLTYYAALHHTSRAVHHALLGRHADGMLIGACDPML